ncbi:MAG: WXG100 family type VII secretion target [Micromonosporaceae bacterium]
MTDMLYSPGEIQMINTAIQTAVKQMDSELDTVESVCKPLEGDAFQGAARTAYLESKQIWREAALEIAQTMNRLAAAVSQSGQSMADADAQAATWFAG